jgi:hypothetical protein
VANALAYWAEESIACLQLRPRRFNGQSLKPIFSGIEPTTDRRRRTFNSTEIFSIEKMPQDFFFFGSSPIRETAADSFSGRDGRKRKGKKGEKKSFFLLERF